MEVSGLSCGSLSKSYKGQSKLLRGRNQGRRFHRIVEPLGQVAVGEQVQSQHRGQIGQRPVGLGEVMQPLQQEQGDQGCPNLDAEGILAGADEGLHGQVLRELLKEQLYLPSVLCRWRQ